MVMAEFYNNVTAFNRHRKLAAVADTMVKPAVASPPPEAAPAWDAMTFNELRAAAKKAGIDGYGKMSKAELIETLEAGE